MTPQSPAANPLRSRRIRTITGLIVGATVALAGCTGVSDNPSSTTSSPEQAPAQATASSQSKAGGDAGGTVPAAVTDVVDKAMAPVTEFPGPKDKVTAPAGKRIMVLVCGSAGTGCVLAANGAKAAIEKLGWQANLVDGKLDPAVWNQLIQQAVTDKVDGIVMTSVTPSLVANGLSQAKAAGIPVVVIFQPKFDTGPQVDGYITSDHAEGGKIAGDWAISDSAGKGKVLVLDEPAYPETTERNDALVDEIKTQCAGCSTVRQQFSAAQMAQSLASQVSASLSQNPDITHVWVPFDAAAPFVQQGIQQAGKTKTVKMFSAEGDPSASARVQAGTQAADLVTADDYMGWLGVDTLVRTIAGANHDQESVVPQRLLTSTNIKDVESTGNTWQLDGVDYKATFAELWGK